MEFILLQATGGGFGVQQIVFFALIFAAFYLFMIRPQQKKQKELKNFRASIEKGDEIITTGGIYGKVVVVEEDVLFIEVDRGFKLKVHKGSVTAAGNPPEAKK